VAGEATGPVDQEAARFVGRSVRRREDAQLLTGRARFIDDVRLPGTLHAMFVRSYVARCRILSVDASAALELPGVRAVFLRVDLQAPVGSLTSSLFPPDAPRAPHRVLAVDDVRYVGEPVTAGQKVRPRHRRSRTGPGEEHLGHHTIILEIGKAPGEESAKRYIEAIASLSSMASDANGGQFSHQVLKVAL
jgi:xanthine dehydrogenase molybdopterin-binding subunit B